MKAHLELSDIKELDSVELHGKEVLEIVLDDFRQMRNLALEIRNLADEAGYPAIVSAFEDDLAQYDKNMWFIKAMLK